jgi:hypothetical protein
MRIRTKGNSRGLRDIRTHSGRVNRVGIPYMAFMHISCLEMEKARREKERLGAQVRINDIDRRIKEIDAEKDLILKGLGERKTDASHEPASPKGETTYGKGVLRLKY